MCKAHRTAESAYYSGGSDIPTLPVGHSASGGRDAGYPGEPPVAGSAEDQLGPGQGDHVPSQVSHQSTVSIVMCHVSCDTHVSCVMFHVSCVMCYYPQLITGGSSSG